MVVVLSQYLIQGLIATSQMTNSSVALKCSAFLADMRKEADFQYLMSKVQAPSNSNGIFGPKEATSLPLKSKNDGYFHDHTTILRFMTLCLPFNVIVLCVVNKSINSVHC